MASASLLTSIPMTTRAASMTPPVLIRCPSLIDCGLEPGQLFGISDDRPERAPLLANGLNTAGASGYSLRTRRYTRSERHKGSAARRYTLLENDLALFLWFRRPDLDLAR